MFKRFIIMAGASCFFATLFTFIFNSISMAQGNIHLGQLKINPYYTIEETYTTNVFKLPAGRESDSILTQTGGINLEFPFRKHSLMLDYGIVDENYRDEDGENTTDHNGAALLQFAIGESFGLRFTDIYQKGHEPRGVNPANDITTFKTNAAMSTIVYAFSDISKVTLDYSFAKWDFNKDINAFRERDEGLASASVYYKILPKTSVFIEYDRLAVDYKDTASTLNSDSDAALLGLTWKITESSTGTLKGGYIWKDYDDEVEEDYDTWTALMEVSHDLTGSASIMLMGSRNVAETNSLAQNYYVETSAGGGITQKFFDKISFTAKGSFTRNKYSDPAPPLTEKRVDKVTSGGAILGYDMNKRISFSIDYTYTEKNSNVAGGDFIDNATTAGISIKL